MDYKAVFNEMCQNSLIIKAYCKGLDFGIVQDDKVVFVAHDQAVVNRLNNVDPNPMNEAIKKFFGLDNWIVTLIRNLKEFINWDGFIKEAEKTFEGEVFIIE